MSEPPTSWYVDVPLSHGAARYLWWGLSNNTRAAYDTAKTNYRTHCLVTGQSPFPATVYMLSSWAAALAQQVAPKTIKGYLCGLRSYHVDIGYNTDVLDVFHHPMLERVIIGIKRQKGEAQTKERRPITRDLLLKLVSLFDQNTLYGATMHSAFCLAFAAFLRVGEFTYDPADRTRDFYQWHVTRDSVSLADDHLELSLPASKTDPFRRGITLHIAAAGDKACPVASFSHLFSHFPSTPRSPLFDTGEAAFTRRCVTNELQRTLKEVGIVGHYSSHSFRRGAATWARVAGLTDAEIRILGRWKSDSYRLYIDTQPHAILGMSRRLQNLRPSTG